MRMYARIMEVAPATPVSLSVSGQAEFDDFCSKCDDFASAVVMEAKSSPANKQRPGRNPRNRPNNRIPNQNRRRLPCNPI
jgi:hypothetical protein